MKRTSLFLFLAAFGLSPLSLYSHEGQHDTPDSFVTQNIQRADAEVAEGEDYPLNFDINQVYTHEGRRLTGVVLEGATDGQQTFSCTTPYKVYTSLLHKSFTAHPGEKVTPKFNFSGDWMHGYVYLDLGQDGSFSAELNVDGSLPEGSDVMSFSYAEPELDSGKGYNSRGELVGDANVLNPPSFVVPENLPYGFYRLRYKVDWASIDPAGRMTEKNSILQNGGAICDIRLNVHGDLCSVSVKAENGRVMVDGEAVTQKEIAFGQPVTLQIAANEGYVCQGLKVRHGYNLEGEQLLHGTPQYEDVEIPAYLFTDGQVTLPAEYIDGNVAIEAVFSEKSHDADVTETDYPLNFDPSLVVSNENRRLNSFTLSATLGGSTLVSLGEETNFVYRDLREKQVSVVPGDNITTAVDYAGRAMHLYLYVDLNQNGRFDATLNADGTPTMSGELLAYTYYNGKNSLGESIEGDPGDVAVDALPAFQLPDMLPTGVYRARLKVDWDNIDPAGRWSEEDNNKIDANGGNVVDFLLNVHHTSHSLKVFTQNGSVNSTDVEGLPDRVPCFQSIKLKPTAAASGYTAEAIVIKHGHNLDGPQYIHGNRQWSEFSVPVKTYTLPADSVDGDVSITLNYEKTSQALYTLVFSDEFDAADGSQPDANKWMRCQRYGATWNRWLSDSEEVIYIEDGKLVARAIPNPDQEADPVPMITGGIKSMGRFGFTYGKVECRAKSNPWTGNFPAIWMMPEDQSAGWPDCGEIDIWEVIDDSHVAYHTVHSNWTYDLGQTGNPRSSFNEPVKMDHYHTYGLEWSKTNLTWYVDGKKVASYSKSSNANDLNQGQWPFDKHFHLILNQSVGNAAWAAHADVNHVYETDFDWIRVYQKVGQANTDGITGMEEVPTAVDFDIESGKGYLQVVAEPTAPVVIYTPAGRCVFRGQGSCIVNLQSGVYIVGGKKVLVP
ncbi:MAG: glycoside hydrolase family 16 protein [Bacteroidaceae bacterium]|nr:glycoside hydrolase family 16 protein [Bacteroidaceae bacterium]